MAESELRARLEVSGDAEGVLRFREVRGELLAVVERFAAHLGAPAEVDGGVTHLGTSVEVERFATRVGAVVDAEPEGGATHGGIFMEGGATHGGTLQGPAARVLHVIGRRGGWSLDALIEGSGLLASAVSSALTLLKLGGRVRFRDFVYDAV